LDPDDKEYHQSKDLVRPYRVGMSCAFCHVSHHPLHPAEDANEPRWANLSSSIGQPWLKSGQVFGPSLRSDHFVFQLLEQTPPGTLDTSLIASDNNNNPNTMNPIWQVAERLRVSVPEQIGEATRALPDSIDERGRRRTPHVLADGADSIGIKGALARVYINIGEFHQEWIRHHNLLVGMRKQTPIPLAAARERSVYWQSSEHRVENLAKFFAKAATRMPLEDAPRGSEHLSHDSSVIERGKRVF